VVSYDLSVSKSGPDTAPANSDVPYSVTVSNLGPDPSGTVVITDTMPAGMTFVSRAQNNGPVFNCTDPGVGNNGNIVCTSAGPLLPGQSSNFTFVMHIPNGTAPGTFFTNQVSLPSMPPDPNDPNQENDSASATTQVPSNNAELAITKVGPDSAPPGTDVTYTITLNNSGPAAATTVVISDTLPGTITFVSLTQNSGPTFSCSTPAMGSGGTVSCNKSPLAISTSTFTLVGHIPPAEPLGSTFSNTATVTSDFDPTPDNNTSTTTLTVTNADVAVVKNGPATVTSGQNVTYSITVSSNGPSPAESVNVHDALPAGTTFVSVTPTTGPASTCLTPAIGSGGSVDCFYGTLNSGVTASFDLVIKVGPTVPVGSTLSNTATATTSSAQSSTANDSSTTSASVNGADLAVTKTGPPTAVQNQDVTYNIGLTNNGPGNATNVTLSDPIPSQATFVSFNQVTGPGFSCSAPAVGSGGTVTCNIATLNSGATATFTLVVHTNASVSGGMINTATASSSTGDPNSGNNSASAATNVVTADLAVTKTSPAGVVSPGSNVTYSIGVTNNGPAAATNVALTDVLPANTTYVSNNQTGGPGFSCTTPAVGSGGTVTCNIASLASGATATFSLVVQVSLTAPGGPLSNTATVSAASPLDPTPTNNSATAGNTIGTIDLAATKTVSAPPYGTGLPVTWTINVANNGTGSSTGVTVTDVLPAGTTFVSAIPSAGSCSGTTTVTCNLGTLAAGASATIALKATLPSTPGPVTNTATATSSNTDANPANNSGSSTITVIAATQIPALGGGMLMLLACVLAGLGAALLKLK
jgi:uncharacterized repeat protein (TIGR01451 family)